MYRIRWPSSKNGNDGNRDGDAFLVVCGSGDGGILVEIMEGWIHLAHTHHYVAAHNGRQIDANGMEKFSTLRPIVSARSEKSTKSTFRLHIITVLYIIVRNGI